MNVGIRPQQPLWHLSPRPFAFTLFLLVADSSYCPVLNTLPHLGSIFVGMFFQAFQFPKIGNYI